MKMLFFGDCGMIEILFTKSHHNQPDHSLPVISVEKVDMCITSQNHMSLNLFSSTQLLLALEKGT